MPSPNLENGHAYWCQSMGHHTAAECNCGWDALLEDAGARQAAVDREESARATRAAEDRAEKERGVAALERIAEALEAIAYAMEPEPVPAGYDHCALHNVDYPEEDGCAACRTRQQGDEDRP